MDTHKESELRRIATQWMQQYGLNLESILNSGITAKFTMTNKSGVDSTILKKRIKFNLKNNIV